MISTYHFIRGSLSLLMQSPAFREAVHSLSLLYLQGKFDSTPPLPLSSEQQGTLAQLNCSSSVVHGRLGYFIVHLFQLLGECLTTVRLPVLHLLQDEKNLTVRQMHVIKFPSQSLQSSLTIVVGILALHASSACFLEGLVAAPFYTDGAEFFF